MKKSKISLIIANITVLKGFNIISKILLIMSIIIINK